MQLMPSLEWLTEGRKGFLFPVWAVAVLRVVYAMLLYGSLRLQGKFNTPFVRGWNVIMPFDWLYLFSAWDTTFYHSIATSWYPPRQSPLWAFFPLYPSLTRLLVLAQVNSWLGLFLVATVCGLLSIPIFFRIAETYLGAGRARTATLLYFLLPPVFVFSGVSYSEPVFLLFSLIAWHFHQRQKEAMASFSAVLCSLARPYGVLIGVPLAYDYFKRKQWKSLFFLLTPTFTLGGWLIYGTARAHVAVPMLSAGSFWQTLTATRVSENITRLVQGDLTAAGMLLPYAGLALLIVVSLGFTVVLTYLVSRIDKALALYVFTSICAIALIAGLRYPVAYRSIPRFLFFLFPIGLSLQSGRRWLLTITIGVLLILDYIAWLAFLTDGFY